MLTDGRLYMDDRGRELKVFDTKDGHGIKMALQGGLKVVWISGRESLATARRARDLGVRLCYQKVGDKEALYRRLCRKWSTLLRRSASAPRAPAATLCAMLPAARSPGWMAMN